MNIADEIASERAVLAKQHPKDLAAQGYSVYSQSDEDGIINEIFRRIGVQSRCFVEFGAGGGDENNTRYLLEKGWKGLWIEGHEPSAVNIRANFGEKIASGDLCFVEKYVTAENINDLIKSAKLPYDIDLLSVDIDGNDYHVFDAIDCVRPRCIVLEHNYYEPPIDYVMPYDPDYIWDFKSSDYGASLVAFVRIAAQKGYRLVGTGMYSPNGFYVRNDLLGDHFSSTNGDAASNWRDCNYEKIVNYPKTPMDYLKTPVKPSLAERVLQLLRRSSRSS